MTGDLHGGDEPTLPLVFDGELAVLHYLATLVATDAQLAGLTCRGDRGATPSPASTETMSWGR